MEELPLNSINNTGILLSRNRPIAFVVGACSFLGSSLVDALLKRNIQVIGLDNLAENDKKNLEKATKHKDFHLINQNYLQKIHLKVPRLDYVFFPASIVSDPQYLSHELVNMLDFIKNKASLSNPKIVLTSSIELYRKDLDSNLHHLKNAEVRLAKYGKEYNLNARIVRLAPVYGPRMLFEEDDPVVRLIQASLLGRIQEEGTSLEFSSRALYISDAVDLILKAVLAGSTAHKIYDGTLINPIKVTDIKQVLLDPSWYEEKGFEHELLPPWTTPNLNKTVKELSWHPKKNLAEGLRETVGYFKDNGIDVPAPKRREMNLSEEKKRLIEESIIPKPHPSITEHKNDRELVKESKLSFKINTRHIRHDLIALTGLLIVVFGLIFPLTTLTIGAASIRAHLNSSKVALSQGSFKAALYETKVAKETIKESQQLIKSLAILKRLGIFPEKIENAEKILEVAEEGIDAANHGALGMYALSKTTKIMSGEEKDDPKALYSEAQLELSTASRKISQVKVAFSDPELIDLAPVIFKPRLQDLEVKLNLYGELIEKAKTAAYLMPQITAVDSRKVYLVLIQNNTELRPTGGFIGSYARVEFEGGRIKKINVDDIYNLDGNLKEHIEPPAEIKNDLGQTNWYLRDSNFEPDFPTSARQAEFFYNKEAGERVHGVFALDLTASGKLIDSVGGLELLDYNEKIDQYNLFEKVISHAEINFFPGSAAKKNYLTNLQTQLFNKIFFLSNQNWPAIVKALGESLEQKHLMIYLADPEIFSYIASQNWSGTFPRQAQAHSGETADFLAPIEANLGANKANYYLERKYRLETAIGKENEILHHLVINYKNNSPSGVFPAGTYKNRLRVYLPAGTRLIKAVYGEKEITKKIASFSDYGRAAFSMLLELAPKEQKLLVMDYQLPASLSFKNKQAKYQLDVFKQPGLEKDSFEWSLTYPINLQIAGPQSGELPSQELLISTDLSKDRSFLVNFTKNE